jgi:lambda repressor-like predicted transcriptional regulator
MAKQFEPWLNNRDAIPPPYEAPADFFKRNAAQIRARLKARGERMSDAAKAIGSSLTLLTDCVNRTTLKPHWPIRFKLAKHLGCDAAELFGRDQQRLAEARAKRSWRKLNNRQSPDKIKKQIAARGETMKSLAPKLGTRVCTLSACIVGLRLARKVRIKLASYLGVSVKDLFGPHEVYTS